MPTKTPRKPIDNRSTAEKYQYTQADSIIHREKQREVDRKKQTKAKHWFISSTFLLSLILVGWLVFGK